MLRVEDGPLLRGKGRFVDDIQLPGLLHAAFFRSSFAHARVTRLVLTKARSFPGVRAVFAYDDLRPLLTCDRIPLALPSGAIRFDVDPVVLAHDELTYVGEPIALIVAESRAIAEDAVSLIELEADALQAVLDPVAGLASGSPRARLDRFRNLLAQPVLGHCGTPSPVATGAPPRQSRIRLAQW